MSIRFNADEIFSIAIKIEENGAAFYRRAAELHSGKQFARTLESLAEMEDGHKRTFEEMKEKLSEVERAEKVFDPLGETALYLGAMGDYHGGEGSLGAREKLTGRESITEIIDIALDLEKKSILYYVGLKDLVPADLGADKIDLIINEEKKHVVQLSQLKSRV